jgi:hypothetical protein
MSAQCIFGKCAAATTFGVARSNSFYILSDVWLVLAMHFRTLALASRSVILIFRWSKIFTGTEGNQLYSYTLHKCEGDIVRDLEYV